MNNQTIARRYFRNLGYRGRYDQTIKKFILYKFDIFKKDKESLAVYVLDKEGNFSSLIDVAKLVSMSDQNIKICLCIHEDFSLPINAHFKSLDSNIDVYIISNNHMELFMRSSTAKIVEKFTIDEIEKNLLNINSQPPDPKTRESSP